MPNAPAEPSSPMMSAPSTILNAMFEAAWKYQCPAVPGAWFGGVWVSVSEESFHYILARWTSQIAPDEPPRFGWLSTWINGYPEPSEIRCNIFLRSGTLRPRIVLQPTEYPLAVEQHRGITLDRVKEIAAGAGHP